MRNTQIISLLFYDSVLTYKGFSCTDFGIGNVVAGTTPVTIFEDTFTQTGDWFHLPTLTYELTLHQGVFGFYILKFLNLHIIKCYMFECFTILWVVF